jgi:L-aspartate oxidase
LEPRDVVSRAVWARMQQGHQVFLDARQALGSHFASHFPSIAASCAAAGIDPAVAPIPIRPAAHYHMGGIAVDAACRSTIQGLWACGEAACTGLHGANRLASNSLLEAAITGQIAARDIAGTAARRAAPIAVVTEAREPENADKVRAVLSQHAGVLRDADGLRTAISALLRMAETSDPAALALMMTAAMLLREESRGGHARTDFPNAAAPVRTSFTLGEARSLARAATQAPTRTGGALSKPSV